MESITKNTVSFYIKSLQKQEYTAAEIQRKLASVDKFISWAHQRGYIEINQFKQIQEEIAKHINSALQTSLNLQQSSFHNKLTANSKSPMANLGIRQYVGLGLMVLLISFLGFGIYNRFFNKAPTPFAYSTIPTGPGVTAGTSRFISFQGRLTDTLGNPIVAPIDITYNFYTVSSGGSPLGGSTRVCTASPDQDGIFSNLIGNDSGPSCNTGIANSVFTENPVIYLGVKVGSDPSEMTPRQQIANVGYAINAETLQGLPPGQNTSNIPFINRDGDMLIAAANPGIRSTYASANFTVSSAKAVIIQSAGADDITLSASDGGTLRFKTYNGSLLERMTILNTGNVGISNTNPQTALDVIGDASASGNITVGQGSTIRPAYGPLSLAYKSALNAWTTGLTLQDTTGNVGIGTTSPSSKLQVSGLGTFNGLATGWTKTYVVDPNGKGDFTSLTAALNGTSGAAIFKLVPGTITEPDNVELRSNITIIGSGGITSSATTQLSHGLKASSAVTGVTIQDIYLPAPASNGFISIDSASGSKIALHNVYLAGSSSNTRGVYATGLGFRTPSGTGSVSTGFISDNNTTLDGSNVGSSYLTALTVLGNGSEIVGGKLAINGTTAGANILNSSVSSITHTGSSAGRDIFFGNYVAGTANWSAFTPSTSNKYTLSGNYFFGTPTFSGSSQTDIQIYDTNSASALSNSANVSFVYNAFPLRRKAPTSTVSTAIFQNSSGNNKLEVGQHTIAISNSAAQSGNLFELNTSGVTGGDILVANSSGNVGIGTTDPGAYKLRVNGTIAPLTADQDLGDSTYRWDLFANSINADSTVTLTGIGSGTGTALCRDGSNNVVTCTGGGGITLQNAYDNGNTITTTTGRNISITLADVATDTTFNIYQAGTDGAAAFRVDDETGLGSDTSPFIIDQSGNVGVGKTAPLVKLDVTGDASASGNITVGQGSTIRPAYGPLSLAYKSALNAWTTGLTLQDSTGNVGIGSTNPTALLDVAGDIKFGGTGANKIGTLTSNTTQVTVRAPSSAALGLGANGGNSDIYITTGNNVGIGTTIPLEKLDVSGNASVSGNLTIGQTGVLRSQYGPLNLAYKSGLNAWSTGLTLQDTTGFVGIGTTNPQNKLHVVGTAASGTELVGRFDSSAQYAGFFVNNSSNRQAKIVLGQNGTEKWQFGTDYAAAGTADFYIYDNTGSRNPLYVTTAGDVRLGGTSGYAGTQAMTILQTGNVGIGSTNPTTAKLVINTAAAAEGLDLSTTDSYANLRVIRNSLNASDKDMYIGYQSGATSSLHLYSNNTETLTVKAGNVGIGTTDPGAYKLRVNGTIAPLTADQDLGDSTYRWDLFANSINADSTVTLTGIGSGTGTALCRDGSNNVVTCTGGGGITLQNAYDNGNTITTTTGRNISITLADVATDTTFNIYQAGTDGAAAFRVDDETGLGSDTSPFIIDQSGNVGVGKTAPLVKLDVTGDASASGNITVGQGSTIRPAYGPLSLAYKSALNAWTTGLTLQDSTGNVGIGSTRPTQTLDVNGSMTLAGGSSILFTGTSNKIVNASATDLGFQTSNQWNVFLKAGGNVGIGGTTADSTPTLFAGASGNVGIGTTSITSGYELDVINDIRAAGEVFADGGSYAYFNAAGSYLGGTTVGAGGAVGYTGSSTTALWAGSGMPLVLGTNGSEYVRITSGGNVGIGTTIPQVALDIVGSASASGNITVGQGSTIRPAYGPLSLAYKSALNAWTTGLTLQDTTGNVGIGTTNPLGKLHVYSYGPNTGDIGGNVVFNRYYDGTWRGGAIYSTYTNRDSLAFAVSSDTTPLANGKIQMVVQDNGNVGIGSTSPGYKLDVNGSTRATAFYDYDNTNYYVDPTGATSAILNGNVGIGTTDPGSYKLRVNGTIAPLTADQDLGDSTYRWDLFANSINADSTVTLTGIGSGTGTALCRDGSNNVVTCTGGGGITLQNAYDNGNTITTTTGRNISITLADVATDTTFNIYQAGTDGAAAFRVDDETGLGSDTSPFIITQTGNVGIGSTSPGSQLVLEKTFNFGNGNVISQTIAHNRQLQSDLETGNSTGLEVLSSIDDQTGNNRRLNASFTAIRGFVTLNNTSRGYGNIIGIESSIANYSSQVTSNDTYLFKGVFNNANRYTNIYGLYLPDLSGVAGTSYGVYSVNGTNYFGGNVGIGTTNPSDLLQVGSAAGVNALYDSSGGIFNVRYQTANRVSLAQNAASSFSQTGAGLGGIRLMGSNGSSYGYVLAGPTSEVLLNPISGNVGIGTTNPIATLDVSGDLRTSNSFTRSLTRTIPTTVNDEVDIGSWNLSNGGGTFWVSVTVPSGGYSQAKNYILPVQYAQSPNNTWVTALPISNTGSYSSQDVDLDIRVNNAVVSLRLRRSLGTTAGTAYIVITHEGVTADSFTPSTATSSVSAPTAYFSSTALTQVGGNVGIGTTNPAEGLDVSGTNPRIRIAQASAPGVTTDKLYNVSGSLYWNGTPLSTGGSIPGATEGYTLRGNGSSWQATSSLFNKSDGNIGIGTTNPAANAFFGGGKTINLFDQTSNLPNVRIQSTSQDFSLGLDNSSVYLYLATSGSYRIYTGGTEKMRLSSAGGLSLGNSYVGTDPGAGSLIVSGNIGIGTTTAGAQLQIGSDASSFLRINNSDITSSYTTDSRYGLTSNGTAVYSLPANHDGGALLLSSSTGDSIISGGGAGAAKLEFFVGDTAAAKMAIDNTGNVGIGTTLPLEKLDVSGNATVSGNLTIGQTGVLRSQYGPLKLAYKSGLDTWATGITLQDTTGNVGIGTTHPTQKLSLVNGSAGFAGLTNVGLSMENSNHQYMMMFAPANTQQGILIGGGANNEARILWEDGSRGNYLDISGGTTISLNGGGGNVGIGTTNPGDLFTVKTSTNDYGIQLQGATTSVSPTYKLADTGGTVYARWGIAGSAGNLVTGASANDLVIRTQSKNIHFTGDGGTTAHMTISSGGSIGIGTTSPGGKLDVQGTLRLGAALGVNDILNTTSGSAPSGNLFWGNRTVCDSSGNCGVSGATGYVSLQSTTPGTQQSGHINISGTLIAGLLADASNQNYGIDPAGTGSFGGYSLKVTGSSLLAVDSGNVGIGTTTTAYKLDVRGGTGTTIAYFDGRVRGESASANDEFVTLGQMATGGGGPWTRNNPYVYLTTGTDNVGIGTTQPGQKLDVKGTLRLSETAGYNPWDISSIYNYTNSDLIFANNSVEKFRFNNNGNLGIGTTNPVNKIHLISNSSDGLRFSRTDGTWPTLVETLGNGNLHIRPALDSSTVNTYGLWLQGGNGGTAGYIGVGTTSPSQLLHVSKDAGVLRLSNAANSNYADLEGSYGYFSVKPTSSSYGLVVYKNDTAEWINMDYKSGNYGNINVYNNNPLYLNPSGNVILSSTAGNVGIGTTNPGDKVSVVSSITTGNVVSITDANASQTTATLLNVVQSGVTTGFTGNMVNMSGTSTTGTGTILNLTTANTTAGNGFNLTANGLTTGIGMNLSHATSTITTGSLFKASSTVADNYTTGGLLSVTSNAAFTTTANTGGLVNITSSNASQVSSTLLNVAQSGVTTGFTGNVVNIIGTSTTGTGTILNLTTANTTAGNGFNLTANGLTTGIGMNLSHATSTITTGSLFKASSTVADNYTTGGLLSVTSNAAFTTTANTGGLVNITSSNASQVSSTLLNVAQSGVTTGFTGNVVNIIGTSTTGTGTILNLTTANTTAGNGFNLTANGLTTGIGMNLSHATSTITTGSLFKASSTVADNYTTGGLLSVTSNAAFTTTANTGGLVNITSSNASQVSSTLLNVAQSGVTTGFTGNVVNIIGTSTTGTGTILNLTSANTSAGYAMRITSNGLAAGTGLYLSSSSTGLTGDLANFTASGSNAAVTGNVLKVGLTGASAVGTALNVTTAGSGGYALRVNDNGTYTDSDPFVIDYNGNVGIGTTNPSLAKLQITSGNISVDSTYGIDTGAAGTLNLGNSTATTINLGSANTTRTINIGTGTNTDTINIGTGGTNADSINIGGLATTATTFKGYMYRGLPLRFTYTQAAAVNASDATKDSACTSAFGNAFQAARIQDVAMNSNGGVARTTGFQEFTVAGEAANKYNYSADYATGESDAAKLQAVGATTESQYVACIRKDAPMIFTRGTVAYTASAGTKDSQCTSEYGSGRYRGASLIDALSYYGGFGVTAGSSYFNVVSSTGNSYYPQWDNTNHASYVQQATGGTYTVACVMIDQASGADYAETIGSNQSDLQPAEILVSDPNAPKKAMRSQKPYDTSILGVVTTQPGFVVGEEITEGYETTVALNGRVPVKVTNNNGVINIGDPVTTSEIPGVGMKATKKGSIVGKALESSDKCGSSVCSITLFINLGYMEPLIQISSPNDLALQEQNNRYQIALYNNSDISEKIGVYIDLVVGNIKAGLISTQKLIVHNSAQITDLSVTSLTIGGKTLQQFILDTVQNAQVVATNIQQITTSSLQTIDASVGNLIVREKIISPVVETAQLTTNVIKPQEKDIAIDLNSNQEPIVSSQDKNALSKLVITGLNNRTVASIDASGNATFSGTIAAKEASISGSLAANQVTSNQFISNEASISGTLIAKEIHSENIKQLTTENRQLSTDINEIQQQLAQIKNTPLPDLTTQTNIANTTDLNNQQFNTITSNQLTVTGNTNIFNLSIANSLVAGTLFLQNDRILSLSSDLKLSALERITMFDGAVVIAKNGTITTTGEIIAQAGVRTNAIKPLTEGEDIAIQLNSKLKTLNPIQTANSKLKIVDSSGNETASIDASGSAEFNSIAFKQIATNSAFIADSGQRNENNEIIPAIKTNAESAGTSILPANTKEIIIYNDRVTENSLIYLTPVGKSVNSQLTVVKKAIGYFSVSIGSIQIQDLQFNWLIIN